MRRIVGMCFLIGCFLSALPADVAAQDDLRTVHIFVALADNRNQGIVPVPASLGNGADPAHNLYWGAGGGVKTYFSRSQEWELLPHQKSPKPEILERCVFKYRGANVYLVADAYRGDRIAEAITDFLIAAAAGNPETLSVEYSKGGKVATRVDIQAAGGSDLVAYIGHDGFMDFTIANLPKRKASREKTTQGGNPRQAIILACISKNYFAKAMANAGAYPLIWTTGLMAPEAYTLKSALDGWIAGESNEQIRERAAAAYDRYQKCGIKGARRLLVSGW